MIFDNLSKSLYSVLFKMIEIENATDLKGKTTDGKVQPQKRNVLIGCTGSVATIKMGNIIEQLQSSKYQVSLTWMLTRLKPQRQGLNPFPGRGLTPSPTRTKTDPRTTHSDLTCIGGSKRLVGSVHLPPVICLIS